MPFVNRIGSGATRKFGFGTGVKPGAPTIGTATRGDQQASVVFTEPAVLGTGAPTYTATSSPGGLTASGASSPVVVTGLTNGTEYTFTVTASNSFGSSTSGSSNSVTPAGVPATPSAPTQSAGNASVALSWTAPSANGSAITDYKIYYATSEAGTYTLFSDTVSTTTSVTVTGLTNGTAYYFKIAAVNSVGDSALSAASASSTPAAPPFFPFFPTFAPPFFPFFPFFPDFVDPCAGVNCAAYGAPPGGVWQSQGFNTQPWDPHCINAGYPADPPYCCNFGTNTCGSGNSYWTSYISSDGCCQFNLYVYCACS
jgi:hypothetical protein